MQDRIYIARFGEGIEAYEALLCPELKEKCNRIKHQIKRRAGMAAALLFQYAVARQYEAEQCEIAQFKTAANAPEFEEVDFANVIEYLKIHDLKLPKIQYGPKGKPYVKENRWNGKPFYYNLSHSGNLVACVISDAEVGIDVQECKDIGFLQMAGKYYAPEEVSFMVQCPQDECKREFYRLWTRKEAYGKMTGEGVAGYLGKVVPDDVVIKEIDRYPEYCICVCKDIEK